VDRAAVTTVPVLAALAARFLSRLRRKGSDTFG